MRPRISIRRSVYSSVCRLVRPSVTMNYREGHIFRCILSSLEEAKQSIPWMITSCTHSVKHEELRTQCWPHGFPLSNLGARSNGHITYDPSCVYVLISKLSILINLINRESQSRMIDKKNRRRKRADKNGCAESFYTWWILTGSEIISDLNVDFPSFLGPLESTPCKFFLRNRFCLPSFSSSDVFYLSFEQNDGAAKMTPMTPAK